MRKRRLIYFYRRYWVTAGLVPTSTSAAGQELLQGEYRARRARSIGLLRIYLAMVEPGRHKSLPLPWVQRILRYNHARWILEKCLQAFPNRWCYRLLAIEVPSSKEESPRRSRGFCLTGRALMG